MTDTPIDTRPIPDRCRGVRHTVAAHQVEVVHTNRDRTALGLLPHPGMAVRRLGGLSVFCQMQPDITKQEFRKRGCPFL